VVIAIIAVLVGLLLPALSAARAAANASAAANNLSSFGRGLILFSNGDPDGRFCSGAFDHVLDGDIRSRGWVADLIGSKVAIPGKALDPASRWKVSETVADYAGAARQGTSVPLDGSEHGWTSTSYAAISGSAYFGSIEAMNDVWFTGHNTNVATTWQLCRGDPQTTLDNAYPGFGSIRGSPVEGTGPLDTGVLGRAATTPARIALMGPARACDGPSFVVRPGSIPLRTGVADGVINRFVGFRLVHPSDLLLDSFTDGMNVVFQDADLGGGPGRKIHELSDIHPLHQPKARGVGGFAPLLFADGHVDRVADTCGPGSTQPDGFIGNGVVANATGAITGHTIDGPSYQEAADQVWLRRLESAILQDGTKVEP
jgi:prepilin-type processing-associated H-X9-DG protein